MTAVRLWEPTGRRAISPQHAFYYAGANAVDLNTLALDLPAGVALVSAQRIANQGLILVSARKRQSEPLTQFLLTPVAGN